MAFDRNDATDLQTLQDEIILDPRGYGYNQNNTNAGVLIPINQKRNAITVSNEYLESARLQAEVNFSWYNNLTGRAADWLEWMTRGERVKITRNVRRKLTATSEPGVSGGTSIWHADNKTAAHNAMLDMIDIDGSRAEELFGFGTVISKTDWIAARDS